MTNIASARLALRAAGLTLHSQVTWKKLAPGESKSSEPDRPVALLDLVVHLTLAAEPREHLAVALDIGREALRGFSTADLMVSSVIQALNCLSAPFELAAKQHSSWSAALLCRDLWR